MSTRTFFLKIDVLNCFIPQGGKGTFLYGVQLSFSFNLLYGISTPRRSVVLFDDDDDDDDEADFLCFYFF